MKPIRSAVSGHRGQTSSGQVSKGAGAGVVQGLGKEDPNGAAHPEGSPYLKQHWVARRVPRSRSYREPAIRVDSAPPVVLGHLLSAWEVFCA